MGAGARDGIGCNDYKKPLFGGVSFCAVIRVCVVRVARRGRRGGRGGLTTQDSITRTSGLEAARPVAGPWKRGQRRAMIGQREAWAASGGVVGSVATI